jgi:hypothetical protein
MRDACSASPKSTMCCPGSRPLGSKEPDPLRFVFAGSGGIIATAIACFDRLLTLAHVPAGIAVAGGRDLLATHAVQAICARTPHLGLFALDVNAEPSAPLWRPSRIPTSACAACRTRTSSSHQFESGANQCRVRRTKWPASAGSFLSRVAATLQVVTCHR